MTLYQLFIIGWISPTPEDAARYEFLVKQGLAETAKRDGIIGYQLSEAGIRAAHRRWGRIGRAAA